MERTPEGFSHKSDHSRSAPLSGNHFSSTKVNYLPLEAAIRWSGLARHEEHILATLTGKPMPGPNDFPKWPDLLLNTERIFDALINRELRFGISGVTSSGSPPLGDPCLTIRHVDLKAWMKRFYPEHRPGFLFSRAERSGYPISLDAIQALVLQREALRAQVEQRDKEIVQLRSQYCSYSKKRETHAHTTVSYESLSARGETTYLHIVGGLLNLLLGRSPSGLPYSTFKTQESVISAMVAHHGDRLGIAERTLQAKFADAKRRFSGG